MSDAWDLPSGGFGPQKPYTLEILDPKFGIDPTDQFAPDTVQLQLKGRTDDPEWEEWTLALKVEKKGWNILSDGKEIKNDNERKVAPSGNTQYGRFINSIKNAEDPKVHEELMQLLRQRGIPTQADIWKGLKLVVGENRDTFKDKDTNEEREYFYATIVGFEGSIDDGELQSLNADAEQAKEQQMEQLRQIAKDEDDHANFANRALSEAGVTDPELISNIMDAGSEGFYAKNH